MSLVIHYWIGDVQDSEGVSYSKMTYIVSGEALNSTHSLQLLLFFKPGETLVTQKLQKAMQIVWQCTLFWLVITDTDNAAELN